MNHIGSLILMGKNIAFEAISWKNVIYKKDLVLTNIDNTLVKKHKEMS